MQNAQDPIESQKSPHENQTVEHLAQGGTDQKSGGYAKRTSTFLLES